MPATKKNPYRKLRMASSLLSALNLVLEKGKVLHLDLEKEKITITKVDLSNDFKLAKCYFTTVLFKTSREQLELAFAASAKKIRYFVAEIVDLKYIPELRFFYDLGSNNEQEVNQLLDKLGILDK